MKQLKFGIPTLDNLFLGNEKRDSAPGGIVLPRGEMGSERTSVCIVGPDGSGKSLFALHLASRYAADVASHYPKCKDQDRPQVIFVSTDFSYARALSAWDNFDLRHPYGRKIPFESLLEPFQRRTQACENYRRSSVELEQRFPFGPSKPISEIFPVGPLCTALQKPPEALDEPFKTSVKFLDVAGSSSGDDWAFVSRLLALLPPLGTAGKDDPAHMLIIDAVEGFETLVGEVDQFGEQQSRRARIAQIIRLAAPKAHVVFVAEEPEAQPSIPEQFVADVVLRLRREQKQGITRHTLEVEKARGQRHAVGPQPYFIRDGSGSSTGKERNLDDPRIFSGMSRSSPEPLTHKPDYVLGYENILGSGISTQGLEDNFQGYVHVTHSITQRSREIIELDRETGFPPTRHEKSSFGIANLDSLLPSGSTQRGGLPKNRLSAMIGEAGTNKSRLALGWMAEAFVEFAGNFAQLIGILLKDPARTLGDIPSDRLPLLVRDSVTRDAWPHLIAWVNNPASITENAINAIDKLTGEERHATASVGYGGIDAAFVYQYRRRSRARLVATLETEWERGERAAIAASRLLRYRYGLVPIETPSGVDDGVAVFLSTRDDTAENVAQRLCERLVPKVMDRDWPNHAKLEDKFKQLLTLHVQRRLVVRRLEIHNATPESVFHIIETLIHAGRRELLGEAPYQKVYLNDNKYPEERRSDDERCFRASGNLRFVLDDFSSFRDSYPDLRIDSVFLPFLAFWLGRMGATGLIVCTSDGQPTREVVDPVEVQLRALVGQRIQTWRVAFHGTQRVAITAIPSPSSSRPSPVREIVVDNRGQIDVSREFELYGNVGQNRPERVPLEIRMFSHTSAANTFIAEENKVFRSVFGTQSPSDQSITEPGAILWGARTEEYDVLRDFCHLQGGSRLDRTIVLQIDEFWLAGAAPDSSRSALRDLSYYLTDENFEDAYGIFKDPQKHASSKPRWQHFKPIIDQAGMTAPQGPLPTILKDRIPFTWDFGFLMCEKRAWEEALEQALPTFRLYRFESNVTDVGVAEAETVGKVWRALPGAATTEARGKLDQAQPSWYDFLRAASSVARYKSLRSGATYSAFEFSRMSRGTILCVLFEIWASEIYRWLPDEEQRKSFLTGLGTPHPEQPIQTVSEWSSKYRFELFMSILLLTEVMKAEDIQNSDDPFEVRLGDPLHPSVATRHWYQTACNHANDIDFVPVGLPGHFSVRGDWFLAVAQGSRSDLLAERALDLLSSKRSNVMRMQLGMGLATRDLGTPSKNRTRLSWYTDQRRRLMSHEELAGLGACQGKGERAFGWFWRSALKDYDRQSRILRKWLAALLRRWYEHESYLDHEWVRGFELYDFLSQRRKALGDRDGITLDGKIWDGKLQNGHLKTWIDFVAACDDLVLYLKHAGFDES